MDIENKRKHAPAHTKRMSLPQKLKYSCPYNSNMVLSPQNYDDDSQQTIDDRNSAGPCPPAQTSAEHRNDVLATASRLYTKRAKYNNEIDNIRKTDNDNIAEKMEIDKEQERINMAIEALEKRKKELEKATAALKDREEAAKAQLDKIENGICKMNEQIKQAFLD